MRVRWCACKGESTVCTLAGRQACRWHRCIGAPVGQGHAMDVRQCVCEGCMHVRVRAQLGPHACMQGHGKGVDEVGEKAEKVVGVMSKGNDKAGIKIRDCTD